MSTVSTMATMSGMSSSVNTLLPPASSLSTIAASSAAASPLPPSSSFTSLPPPSHPLAGLSSCARPTSSGSLSTVQPSPSLSTFPPSSSGSLMTNLPSSLSTLPPSSLSLPPPHFQPVLEPSLHHHPVQVETVQAGGDVKERRPSLTLGSLQQHQHHATNPQQQQQVSNPQHQFHNHQQQQHFNLLQQPNIVQQLNALQQQQHQHALSAGAVTSAIDYTPLKVHEALASRAASPISAAGRADEGHFDLARLLQYQHPAYGTVLPPSAGTNLANIMTTSANGANNPDQQQQQDQGWRLPQYRPMLRKEDQPVARREGLPWTGPAPQIGQDRWLPPSAHHQVGNNWTGWQERTPLHLHPDFLRMQMQERFARGDDCASGLSRESSRDDINSECEQQFEYEQRFRVDRRKPELTIVPQGSPGNPPGTTSTPSVSSSL